MDPIQPFFALSTDHYYKKLVNAYGISHIYCFRCEEPVAGSPSVLPDGCVDITFDLTDADAVARVCGSVTASNNPGYINQQGHTYLGIRFLPGYIPLFLDGAMADFVDREVPLELCTADPCLKEQVLTAKTLEEKADTLIRACRDISRPLVIPLTGSSSSESRIRLAHSVQKLISDSRGLIRIQDMEEETGYSRRYISEVFHDFSGFSPKKMCRIVRFQSALLDLTHHPDRELSEVALSFGYYDQSQFSREFTEILHTSPGNYRNGLLESHYLQHFIRL